MMKRRNWWFVLLTALIPLALAAGPASAWRWHYDYSDSDSDEEIPYDEAEIFFELNDTDGDLGIHALIDGDAWDRLEIEDPNERRILNIKVRGRLRRQGLTEIFFESAEPNFDELSPEAFFRRFPTGIYEIEGRTLDGDELESEAEVTHLIPAPAGNVTVNGEPARPADGSDCDEEELPELSLPVVIEFDAVTSTHPDLGETGDIEIIRYGVVAEQEDEDENVFVTSVELAPDDETGRYSVELPEEFFIPGAEVKFEVLAREESFNQTATESCPFEVEEEEE